MLIKDLKKKKKILKRYVIRSFKGPEVLSFYIFKSRDIVKSNI